MSTGVTLQPDSNRIITQNGQRFSLVDQGNSGLKVFLAINNPAYEDDNNPKATLLNCYYYALTYDDDFIENCKQATLHAISVHQKVALKAPKEELALPEASVTLICLHL